MTTAHGGNFQKTSMINRIDANAKSAGAVMAVIHSGLYSAEQDADNWSINAYQERTIALRPYPAVKLFRDAMYASLEDKLPPDSSTRGSGAYTAEFKLDERTTFFGAGNFPIFVSLLISK